MRVLSSTLCSLSLLTAFGCGGAAAQEKSEAQSNLKEYLVASLKDIDEPRVKQEVLVSRLEAMSESFDGMLRDAGASASSPYREIKTDVDQLKVMAKEAKSIKEIQTKAHQVLTKVESL